MQEATLRLEGAGGLEHAGWLHMMEANKGRTEQGELTAASISTSCNYTVTTVSPV